MKNMKTIVIVAFAVAIAFSMPAYAGDGPSGKDKAGKVRAKWIEKIKQFFKKRFDAFFEKADKNGDGVITVDEIPTAEERLAKVDGDGDGQVTKAELAAAIKKRREIIREKIKARIKARGEERFKQADKNGNDVIDRDEFRGSDELFDRINTDGDGALTKEECKVAVHKFFKFVRARRWARLRNRAGGE
jgi:Ca2+-binding EF-hand superfamily protein